MNMFARVWFSVGVIIAVGGLPVAGVMELIGRDGLPVAVVCYVVGCSTLAVGGAVFSVREILRMK